MKIGDSVFVTVKPDDNHTEEFQGTLIGKRGFDWIVEDQDGCAWQIETAQIQVINDENLDFN